MKKIDTRVEAKSLSDLTDDWKIVARRYLGTIGSSPEIHAIWRYCGEIANDIERKNFLRLAFPDVRYRQPLISVVTGRDDAGTLTLYARNFPKPKLRRVYT